MSTPLRVVRRSAGPADTLLVLLPGAYMAPEDFLAGGVDAAPGRFDLALPALDLAVISGGTALAAVHGDVLAPARAGGYQRIWLGGISLGGLLALAYAADGLGPVDGLCLLAPYPGSRITQAAIAAGGGPGVWAPTAEQLADPEFRVWAWLPRRPASLPVFCGYGAADRFADGMAGLAATLAVPAAVRPGGHDWPAWTALWRDFLAGDWLPGGENR